MRVVVIVVRVIVMRVRVVVVPVIVVRVIVPVVVIVIVVVLRGGHCAAGLSQREVAPAQPVFISHGCGSALGSRDRRGASKSKCSIRAASGRSESGRMALTATP